MCACQRSTRLNLMVANLATTSHISAYYVSETHSYLRHKLLIDYIAYSILFYWILHTHTHTRALFGSKQEAQYWQAYFFGFIKLTGDDCSGDELVVRSYKVFEHLTCHNKYNYPETTQETALFEWKGIYVAGQMRFQAKRV